MNWIEILVKLPDPVLEECVSAILIEAGAVGTYIQSEKDKLIIKGYIPKQLLNKALLRKIIEHLRELEAIFQLSKTCKVCVNQVEESDWVAKWKKFFKPIQVTENLTIVPCWETKGSFKTRYVIKIDPGPAFGTGQHPTTQLCLKALELLYNNQESMLDIGTGTGILAIYGAILGIKRILAIDIDPVALKWAEHNIQINGLKDRIFLSSIPVSKISDKFSIITANLLFDELKEVLPYIPFLLKGRLIISGILEEQVAQMNKFLIKHALKVIYTISEKEWVCLICER